MSEKQKIYLTYPKTKVSEPLICQMYDKYKVTFNIRQASVNDEMGLMAVELSAGTRDQIDNAIAFFRDNGVTVEPIEMNVISG